MLFSVGNEMRKRGILSVDVLNSVFPALAGRPALQLEAVDYAEKRGLDWKAGHLIANLRENYGIESVEYVVKLEGYRYAAQKSGRFLGMDSPEYGESKTFSFGDGSATVDIVAPEWISVTIQFLGANNRVSSYTAREYFIENVVLDEFGAPSAFYRKRPTGQLRVRAESQALRGAFWECGSHTEDEADLAAEMDRLLDAQPRHGVMNDNASKFVGMYESAKTAEEFTSATLEWQRHVNNQAASVSSDVFGQVLAASQSAHDRLTNM